MSQSTKSASNLIQLIIGWSIVGNRRFGQSGKWLSKQWCCFSKPVSLSNIKRQSETVAFFYDFFVVDEKRER
jgi:hypothetical protein